MLKSMKEIKTTLLILVLSSCSFAAFGQCKNGFIKSKEHGKKVKVPCINYSEAAGLNLEISANHRSGDSLLIDITFRNPVDSTRSIYWHDFVDSWGIPLSFSFSVLDSNGKMMYDQFNYSQYMDYHVYHSKDQINKKIDIEPNQPFNRTVRVWWPGISAGRYELTVFYGGTHFELSSNKLPLEVK